VLRPARATVARPR